MKNGSLARDLMAYPVRRLTTNTDVREAAEFLLRWGISGAPVVDDHGRPVGVFTLADLARHVQDRLVTLPVIDPRRERVRGTGEPISLKRGFHFEGFEEAKVSELMTPGLVTVFPEATLEEVVRSMSSQKIHRVFVISEEGELLGVITTMDVLKWMDGRFKERKRPLRKSTG